MQEKSQVCSKQDRNIYWPQTEKYNFSNIYAFIRTERGCTLPGPILFGSKERRWYPSGLTVALLKTRLLYMCEKGYSLGPNIWYFIITCTGTGSDGWAGKSFCNSKTTSNSFILFGLSLVSAKPNQRIILIGFYHRYN